VRKQAIRPVYRWGEKVFIFNNVPAEVCTRCGETYFGPESLEQIDEIVETAREPEEVAQVPGYSL
jgi:YgiT-type zinc finger domain-containing protein